MNINSVKNFLYQSITYISEFSNSTYIRHIWVIANKIKNFVTSFFPTPFERPFEQQQVFNQIKKRYLERSYSAFVIPSTPLSQNFILSSQTRQFEKDSRPIQNLRLFARELTTAALESVQEQVENPDLKRVFKIIAPMAPKFCDIFSEIICNIVQKISFENLIDRAVNIMNKECKVHLKAQKATESESARLIYASKIRENYEQEQKGVNYHLIKEDQYKNAVTFIEQVTKAGKEFLLREVYAEAYEAALSNGQSQIEACKQAKATQKEVKESSSHTHCQEAYLRDFYLTTFVNNGGVTRNVKHMALATGSGSEETHYQDLRNYLQGLSEELSNQIISSFTKHINNALFPDIFWLMYFKTDDAVKINHMKNDTVTQLLKHFLTKIFLNLLQSFVSPQNLTQQIAKHILPLVEDEIVLETCKLGITANWKDLSPYFYALEIANKNDQSEISKNITDKIKNTLIEKQMILENITPRRFNKIVSKLLRIYLKSHKLIRQSIIDQRNSLQFNDFIHHLYELVVMCPALSKNEQILKRESTIAYLKASILVMLPQSYRKQGQSLWQEGTEEKEIDTFYEIVTPFIEKIEKKLINRRDNTDQAVDENFIKESLIQFLKNTNVKTLPVNHPSSNYGEMIFNLALEFGGLAPTTKKLTGYIPGIHQFVKDSISAYVSTAVAPYTSSHKKIIKIVLDSLISDFYTEDRKEIDKQKLKDFITSKISNELKGKDDSDTEFYECEEGTIEEELNTVATLCFGLSKQLPFAFLSSQKCQKILDWTLMETLIGDNPATFANTFTKLQNGFLNHRLINLSRIAQFSRLFVQTLQEAEKTS